MNKEEILKHLGESIIVEELAIPIYRKHIDSSLFWSGLPEKESKIVRDKLDILIKESAEHIKILNKLKQFIKDRE